MKNAKRIYVAGPYTKGDVVLNVRHAIVTADALLNLGFAPYVPHLSHFWHLVCPHDYEAWMTLDFEWVKACDAVLRLSGESSGADREEALAGELGIPVFYSIAEVAEYFLAPEPDGSLLHEATWGTP